MIDLWIIAAGKGTRMGGMTIPKCLIEIDGKSNLENTLELIGHKFDTVFIVVSYEMEEIVKEVMHGWGVLSNVEIIAIECGGGDGKAVLEAYEARFGDTDPADIPNQSGVILWGDAHLRSSKIVDELLIHLDDVNCPHLIIPVVSEKRPYVAIITSNFNSISMPGMSVAMSADFIKFGEVREEGFHDQSIFGCSMPAIISALEMMRTTSCKRDCDGNVKYTTQSGELTFLNIVHFMWNIGDPAHTYITKYPLMGYNTPEELEKIKRSIKS